MMPLRWGPTARAPTRLSALANTQAVPVNVSRRGWLNAPGIGQVCLGFQLRRDGVYLTVKVHQGPHRVPIDDFTIQ